MAASVTIGIPTYRSESFIHRTINCARAQTHTRIRIVVSVDPSDDRTVEVCRRHASEDRRVEVLVQRERLGWSQNANAVLDRFDTEFGCLYFHDDILEPTYVEKLLRALAGRPDAASAHCDLVEFGLVDAVRPAHDYHGPAFMRLIDFILTQRGTTLRSLTRTERFAEPLRFPTIEGDGCWSAYVFHLRLLAAGPAVAVHESLYRRWQREGSLTRSPGWKPALNTTLHAQREAAALCLRIFGAVGATPDQIRTGLYCLRLFQRLFTRREQRRLGDFAAIGYSEAVDVLGAAQASLVPGVLDAAALEWVRLAEKQLAALDLELERERKRKQDVDRSLA